MRVSFPNKAELFRFPSLLAFLAIPRRHVRAEGLLLLLLLPHPPGLRDSPSAGAAKPSARGEFVDSRVGCGAIKKLSSYLPFPQAKRALRLPLRLPLARQPVRQHLPPFFLLASLSIRHEIALEESACFAEECQ